MNGNTDYIWISAALSDARSRFEWGFSPVEVFERVMEHYQSIAEVNPRLTDSTVATIREELISVLRLEE